MTGDESARYTSVIVGDSFVDGAGATDRWGWADRVGAALEDTYDTHVKGHGGDTIEDVLERTAEDVVDLDPDLVILQVGINDSRRRESLEIRHDVPPVRYDAGLREFVTAVRTGCRPHTGLAMVGTTPVDEDLTSPYKPDKRYVDLDSRRYNAIACDVCRESAVRFVDVFERFEREREDRELLADGLHPNDEGHELIATAVLETLAPTRVATTRDSSVRA